MTPGLTGRMPTSSLPAGQGVSWGLCKGSAQKAPLSVVQVAWLGSEPPRGMPLRPVPSCRDPEVRHKRTCPWVPAAARSLPSPRPMNGASGGVAEPGNPLCF